MNVKGVKMSLEAKLAQAKRDRKLQVESADKEIEAIKQEIAASKTTYSRGDRFKGDGGRKWLLVNVDGRVSLVGLEDGYFWCSSKDVLKQTKITQKEMSSMIGHSDMVRYYDARKGCRV